MRRRQELGNLDTNGVAVFNYPARQPWSACRLRPGRILGQRWLCHPCTTVDHHARPGHHLRSGQGSVVHSWRGDAAIPAPDNDVGAVVGFEEDGEAKWERMEGQDAAYDQTLKVMKNSFEKKMLDCSLLVDTVESKEKFIKSEGVKHAHFCSLEQVNSRKISLAYQGAYTLSGATDPSHRISGDPIARLTIVLSLRQDERDNYMNSGQKRKVEELIEAQSVLSEDLIALKILLEPYKREALEESWRHT
ncbi:hypothetical protein J5N97_014116 [Dioscorea zingiberensis]|uniref:Uncharacterized protein n=1 Tax=Dioscorea zingiberensis TaxID=325984 RepID=A0A9D5CU76_9LILI|nr:hypothetical protein J5N97_014116 [Dioscorea zingiberensis]